MIPATSKAQKNSKQAPTLEEEMALLSQGYSFIAGLDEAGRGSLAGPVVAAAVILPLSDDCSMCLAGVRDSKQLTAQAREQLYEVIIKYAMRAALAQLAIPPQALLLDAINLPGIALPQRSIIKGDMLCLSIAAASIIAKVTRDGIMIQLHEQYPAYGFAQHKGYGTEAHLVALHRHGASPR